MNNNQNPQQYQHSQKPQQSQQIVNTVEATSKKKGKIIIIVTVVLLVLALVGVGIYFVTTLFNNDSDADNDNDNAIVENSGNNNYTKQDEEKITSIITEADALATQKDYEKALEKINSALKTYPKSEELKKKSEEYTAALNAQIKATTLEEAERLAQSGDYSAAMALIKNAQDTYGEDADYQSAYETYDKANKNAIKSTALETANGFAQQQDYLNAYNTITQAITTVGEDIDLSAKAEVYGNEYVLSISSQVDVYLNDNDIENAKALLESVDQSFHNNETIISLLEQLGEYKTVSLDTLSPINGGFNWNDGTPEDPFGNLYTDVHNFVILHAGNGLGGYHGGSENNCTVEYKLDEFYDYLTFVVSPYSDFGESGRSYIQVYVDGVLRYTTPQIAQKSSPFQTPNIDVSDAEYITIKVHVGTHGCIMLSDMLLGSSPTFVSSLDGGMIPITSLGAFNGSMPWEQEYPRDILQNNYSNTCNYAVLHSGNGLGGYHAGNEKTHSVEYYIAKKYAAISLNVAPASCFTESGSARVKVYADDVLVYTSATITQKTALFNTGTIDLSGANYVKIIVELKSGSCTLMSDVLLKTAE